MRFVVIVRFPLLMPQDLRELCRVLAWLRVCEHRQSEKARKARSDSCQRCREGSPRRYILASWLKRDSVNKKLLAAWQQGIQRRHTEELPPSEKPFGILGMPGGQPFGSGWGATQVMSGPRRHRRGAQDQRGPLPLGCPSQSEPPQPSRPAALRHGNPDLLSASLIYAQRSLRSSSPRFAHLDRAAFSTPRCATGRPSSTS